MKNLITAAAIVMLVLPAMALAAEFPHYDVVAVCHNKPMVVQRMIPEETCVGADYVSRGLAADLWRGARPEVQTECAASSFHDYSTLYVCLNSFSKG